MSEPDFTALLDGLAGSERAARQDLLRRLHADGFTLEELEAAAEAGEGALLAGLDAEWALQARDEHVADLAEVLGAPVVFLGVGLPDDAIHSPNERVVLPMLERGAEAAAYLWSELASPGANLPAS
jgi:acetylornithine deacetylase/succinyl-diaminopimelate desuccinylase-like protein